MKNLSKRNKLFLGIGGGIVVLAVLVVVFFQVGGGELFGASILNISPSNPTINIGQAITASVSTSYSNCSWSSSNSAIFKVASSNKSATVTGVSGGKATLKLKCGLLSTGSTTVTVRTPSQIITPHLTSSDIIYAGADTRYDSLTLSTGDTNTSWSSNCVIWLSSNSTAMKTATGSPTTVHPGMAITTGACSPNPNGCWITATTSNYIDTINFGVSACLR